MSIYISTITSGNPSAHFVMSLLRLERHLLELEGKFPGHQFEMVVGLSPVQVARNHAVRRFLSIKGATHLCFVDDDQVFAPESIPDLYAAQKPIVGALIPQKIDAPRYAVTLRANPRREGDLVEVETVGTGMMMIERSVLELMIECGYQNPFDCETDADTGRYMGEDYTFCKRARRLGFESWVHAGLNVGHVGQKIYRPFHDSDERVRLLLGEDVGSGTV